MAIIAPDIGIDLGTANTQIYVKKKGIVINEPSLLVADRGGRHAVRAIGEEARVLLGRTAADVVSVRPMADGMILLRHRRINRLATNDESVRLGQFGDEPFAESAHGRYGHGAARARLEIDGERDARGFGSHHLLDDDVHPEIGRFDAVLPAIGENHVRGAGGADLAHGVRQAFPRHGQPRGELSRKRTGTTVLGRSRGTDRKTRDAVEPRRAQLPRKIL